MLTVIAPVVMEPLGVQVDDISANVIQKALVVGDNQQCLPPALKVAAVERGGVRVSVTRLGKLSLGSRQWDRERGRAGHHGQRTY